MPTPCHTPTRLIPTIEDTTSDTWRNELERMHLVTLEASDGRSATTPRQREVFQALKVAEPARLYDFMLPERVV